MAGSLREAECRAPLDFQNDFQLAAMFIIRRLILSAEGQNLRRRAATGEHSQPQSLASETGKFQIQ